MKIDVKTFATLGILYPSTDNLEMDEGSTVGRVLSKLSIPREKVTIIFINGIHGDFDSVLCDGDRLGLFPPIGGG